MHNFAKAEDNPSGCDRQGSRPPVCHVLPNGFLLNDADQSGRRLARFTVALLLAFCVLLANPPSRAQTPAGAYWTITTVAGTGERGYSGDGGPAVEAKLQFPKGLAVDGAGNLYIADAETIAFAGWIRRGPSPPLRRISRGLATPQTEYRRASR